MSPILVYGLVITITVAVLTYMISQRSKDTTHSKLPPGSQGWPFIGETLAFVTAPDKFIRDRMAKHSPEVFQTSIGGQKTAVFCSPKANKFICANDGKLLTFSLPRSVIDAISYPFAGNGSPAGKPASESVYKFLRVDSLKEHVPFMDTMVGQHLDKCWSVGQEVKVFPYAKHLTYALSCKVFINATPDEIEYLAEPFYCLLDGIVSVPINLPGAPYYSAIKRGKLIREKLVSMIKHRRKEIILQKGEYRNSDGYPLDLLTQLIVDSVKNGTFSTEEEMAGQVIGLIFAGFYPTCTTIAFTLHNLADDPDVYEKVLQEQLKIAKSKRPGESLTWEDIQKMKYSWMAVYETMRLTSPVPASFRDVQADFTYAGFTIPKGWQVLWTLHTTNKNPAYFPNPEKFDPSRFEGNGPAPYTFIPFGARPHVCAGLEFARAEILIFLHNVVTKFKFKRLDLDEKIIHTPVPIPSQGLRILLQALDS